jgi:chromosome segregation ATPase
MVRLKRVLSTAGCAAFLALSLASCSNKATEEQMKTLSELDRQRESLRSDLERAQSSLKTAQATLAQQNKDLADCNSDTQQARERLTSWPNVWADSSEWNPPPPPPPAPAKKSKRR